MNILFKKHITIKKLIFSFIVVATAILASCNEEFEELADLAMRSPGMNHLLRSKLFIGVQAIKENPLERMLKRMMLQGML